MIDLKQDVTPSIAEKYPYQEKPIHEFRIEGHSLVHIEHHHYLPPRTIDGRTGSYQIWTPGHTVYKTPGQLDRFLNNHLWSMDGDEGQAIAYMRARLEEDSKACKKELERLRKLDSQLSSIERDYEKRNGDNKE